MEIWRKVAWLIGYGVISLAVFGTIKLIDQITGNTENLYFVTDAAIIGLIISTYKVEK